MVRTSRTLRLVTAGMVVVALAAVGAAGAATPGSVLESAGGSSPASSVATAGTTLSLVAAEDRVEPDGTVTYEIVVGEVSDGVGSYDVTVTLADTSTARLTGAADAIGGRSRAEVSPSRAHVGAFAGDTVDSGSDVTIATVTVTGVAPGTVDLSLDVYAVGDETNGDQYSFTVLRGASLAVEAPTVGESAGPATDPDGDGLYEDVTGDGDVTAGDADTLFDAVVREDPAVVEHPSLFDFTGDGDVTPADATALFEEAVSGTDG